MRAVFDLRERLLSHLRNALTTAINDGIPIVRPMWFADPDGDTLYYNHILQQSNHS